MLITLLKNPAVSIADPAGTYLITIKQVIRLLSEQSRIRTCIHIYVSQRSVGDTFGTFNQLQPLSPVNV